VRRAVVVALGVVASVGVTAAPAAAKVKKPKLPSTTTVERKVQQAASGDVGYAFSVRCRKSSPTSWSCVAETRVVGDTQDVDYNVTARYRRGHLYIGAFTRR
jgi:hypothetical protein